MEVKDVGIEKTEVIEGLESKKAEEQGVEVLDVIEKDGLEMGENIKVNAVGIEKTEQQDIVEGPESKEADVQGVEESDLEKEKLEGSQEIVGEEKVTDEENG